MNDITKAFAAELDRAGLLVEHIVADGALHRCPTKGKSQGKDGAYILHLDPPAAGWWKNWRTNEDANWTAKGDELLSPEDRARLNARIERDKAVREVEQSERHAKARERAQRILAGSEPAKPDHPYLTRKSVPVLGELRQTDDGKLVVPVSGLDGAVQSLQLISQDGVKRFLTGGKIESGYFPISAKDGSKSRPLVVCEGYATAASLHQATEHACLVAFNAGNLSAVAKFARTQYPEREIIFAADDDHGTKGNPGLTKARQAAREIGAKVAVPRFAEPGGTDFNDLAQSEGLEVVGTQIDAAQPPGDDEPDIPPKEDETWPKPIPFDNAEVPPIPASVLPGWAGEFASALAESVQVPEELTVANVLGAVSTAAARRFEVEVKPGYREPVNNFTNAPLPPGERKSATVAACVQPLLDWEEEQSASWLAEVKEVASRRKTLELAIEGARKKIHKCASASERETVVREVAAMEKDLPEIPTPPRLVADDVTPEQLAVLMHQNQQRLGIISAEGGIFDLLAGRYNNGMANLDLVLKAHSGDSVRVDRKLGEPIAMDNPTLTLRLSPQPEVINGLANRPGFRGRGLLGRFLYFRGRSRLGHRDVDASDLPATIRQRYPLAFAGFLMRDAVLSTCRKLFRIL